MACTGGATAPVATTSGDVPSTGTSPSTSPSPSVAVPDVDLEIMIGPLMVLGFRGTTLGAGNPVRGDLVDRHVGTLLLSAHDVPSGSAVRNITSPSQLTDLCAAIREAAPRPVLRCTDEEGGQVARLSPANGFPATRSAASLGTEGSVQVTRAASAAIATTLAGVGIRLNLSPVVDVTTTSTTRSSVPSAAASRRTRRSSRSRPRPSSTGTVTTVCSRRSRTSRAMAARPGTPTEASST